MKSSAILVLAALAIGFQQGQAVEKKVRLSSGYDMPVVGLGTSSIKPEEMENAIATALESGYRYIDTAHVYNNEANIGANLKKWLANGGKREDLFILSKLPEYGNRPSDVEAFLKDSLEKLGLDYVDMYLIHAPFALLRDASSLAPLEDKSGKLVPDPTFDAPAVWKEMEKQVKAGRAKSIGLSNFDELQIEQVLKNAEIKPSNLQVEVHAYYQQKPLRKFCRDNNITVTGYAPLGSPKRRSSTKTAITERYPNLIDHPIVTEIASNHNRTTGQILLRHAIQEGVIVIPKSSNSNRIKANIDIFDFSLTEDEMKKLDDLDLGENGGVYAPLFKESRTKYPNFPFRKN